MFQIIDFINQYHHAKAVAIINTAIHAAKLIALNTSIYQELEEIQMEYRDCKDLKGKCLEERSTKLIRYFRYVSETGFSGQDQLFQSKEYLTPLIKVKDASPRPTNKREVVTIKPQKENTKLQTFTELLKENDSSYANVWNKSEATQQKKDKKLSVSPNKLINIHEIMKANKEQKINNEEKRRDIELFKSRIQREIEQINGQLRDIKQKQYYTEQSLSDIKIEQLEKEIKTLNQKTMTPPKTPQKVKTIKLDLSCKRKQNKQSLEKNQKNDKSEVRKIKLTNDAQKRTYWKRNDYKESKDFDLSKVMINESKKQQQSIEKTKSSINRVNPAKKSLLSARIEKISRG